MGGYRLTEKVRTRLKHPLGSLVVGAPDKTMRVLREVIESERPTRLFAVGDSVASHMVRLGVEADLYVVDHRVMRKPVEEVPLSGVETVTVSNPAGRITPEACDAVKRAVRGSTRTRIIVDGEEDLLTLPVIKFAPKGSLVVYGQPRVGIVLVRVTEGKRREIEALMDEMKEEACRGKA